MATTQRATGPRPRPRPRSGPSPRLVRPASPLRPDAAVYRRRRLVVGLTLAVLVGTLVAVLAGQSGAAPAQQPESVVLVVGPGDTVLELVRPFAPRGADPRGFADEVLRASGLDGRAVRPGAVLRVPRP